MSQTIGEEKPQHSRLVIDAAFLSWTCDATQGRLTMPTQLRSDTLDIDLAGVFAARPEIHRHRWPQFPTTSTQPQ